MLTAYLDESGIHGDAKVCVIAGFLGSSARWDEVEKQLRQRVGQDAVEPGLHCRRFFARDAKGDRVSEYRGWSDDRANNLFYGTLDVIRSVDIHPVGSIIDVGAFYEYSLGIRRLLTGGTRTNGGKHKLILSGSPDQPYYLPFQSVVIQCLRMVKRPDWKVHFVFDQQNKLSGFALLLYNSMRGVIGTLSKRMGNLVFENRSDALPLQMADLIAYCTYQDAPFLKKRWRISSLSHARKYVIESVPRSVSRPDGQVTVALNVIAHKKYAAEVFNKHGMDSYLRMVPDAIELESQFENQGGTVEGGIK